MGNHDEYHRQLDQMEKSKKSVVDLLTNSELLVSNLKKNDALKISKSDTNGITNLTNSVKELYQNGQKFKTDYESYRNSYHEMKHQVMELEKNGCSINKDMKADIDTNDNELKSGMDRFEKIRDYVQELIDKFNLNIGKPIIISSKNMRNPLCNHDEYHRQLDQMEKSK